MLQNKMCTFQMCTTQEFIFETSKPLKTTILGIHRHSVCVNI